MKSLPFALAILAIGYVYMGALVGDIFLFGYLGGSLLWLGLLLARAGITVTVIEKHEDFLRDFRGDTIHPSTLDVMDQLGCLDEFLALPHQRPLPFTPRSAAKPPRSSTSRACRRAAYTSPSCRNGIF